jgi:hypothetical protein
MQQEWIFFLAFLNKFQLYFTIILHLHLVNKKLTYFFQNLLSTSGKNYIYIYIYLEFKIIFASIFKNIWNQVIAAQQTQTTNTVNT